MAQVRYSKQREAVYEAVMNNPIHPSVNDIYHIVRKTIPDISLGTVYRHLNMLVEQGCVICFDAYDKSHYDARLDPHFHFACKKCGEITDIEINHEILECLISDVESKTKNELDQVQMVFQGVCSHCKED